MEELDYWKKNKLLLTKHGVYKQSFEHDNCGVGLVAAIDGVPKRSVVDAGITALKAVWHRGAVDADGKTGDGAGIQISYPQNFFKNLNFRPGSAYDNAIAPEDVAIAIMGILKTREGTVIDEINLTPLKKVIDFE